MIRSYKIYWINNNKKCKNIIKKWKIFNKRSLIINKINNNMILKDNNNNLK